MGRADPVIPVFHPPPAPHVPTPHVSAPAPSGGGGGGGGTPSSSSSSSSSGGGGGTRDPLAYAKAQQAKADRKASQKYLDLAADLQKQIHGIRLALGKHGFRHNLMVGLRGIGLDQRQADAALMKDYHDRVDSLKNTSEDNEKSAAGQTYLNLVNRSRERSNALTEAQAHGAGESDLLRAQQMSLRSWNSNQAEVNRSFYDTKTSISSSLTDLTVDTRTARETNVREANADRDMEWQNYYDRRSETLTALGNTLGQQAEYYASANEAVSSKKTKAKEKHASSLSGHAFAQASRTSGKAYKNPGIPKSIRNWEGHADFKGDLNNDRAISAATELNQARPEGATLRKWEQ